MEEYILFPGYQDPMEICKTPPHQIKKYWMNRKRLRRRILTLLVVFSISTNVCIFLWYYGYTHFERQTQLSMWGGGGGLYFLVFSHQKPIMYYLMVRHLILLLWFLLIQLLTVTFILIFFPLIIHYPPSFFLPL